MAHPMSDELRDLPPSFEMCDGPNASRVILKAADELDRLHTREAALVAALEVKEDWRELADRAARLWRRPSGHGVGEAVNWLRDYDATIAAARAAIDSTGGAK